MAPLRAFSALAFVIAISALAAGVQQTDAKVSPKVEAYRRVTAMRPWTSSTGGRQGQIPIGYRSTPGRTGWYYLPKGWQTRRMPVMIILHGSGMDGKDMVWHFQPAADKFKFIIIAPESHNDLYWFTAKNNQPFTSDWEHVGHCFSYVSQLPGVRFNNQKIAYAGYSRGGYSAGALASRLGRATHALIFHSLFLKAEFGRHGVPMWVSTGINDPMFNLPRVRTAVRQFRKDKPSFKIYYKAFSGRHSLGNSFEKESAIRWWFRTRGSPN